MTLMLYERGGRLYAHGTIDGERVRKSLGLPASAVSEGRAKLRELEGELRQSKGLTWRSATTRYLARPGGCSRGTRGYVTRLTSWWQDTPLRDIRTEDVERFVRETMPGRRPGTIRRCLVVFKAVLHHVDFKPPRLPRIVVDDARTRWLSQTEVGRLLAQAEKDRRDMLPLLHFLLRTGCRVGEALALEWQNVDMQAGTALLASQKGGRRRLRTVPLTPTVVAQLEAIRQAKGPVFRHSGGEPWRSYFGARKAFLTLAQGAGLVDVRLHDLRRTFASHLFLAGVDLITVAKLLGHEDLTMLKRVYAQVTGAHLGGAVAKLPY